MGTEGICLSDDLGRFLGAVLVTSKAGHLRPEIGDKLWAKRPLLFIRIQNFLTLCFTVFFLYASYNYVAESYEFGDKSVALKVPLWFLQLIIPYTFFSMSLRHLYFLINPQEQLQYKREYS
jgi:TRAP-type C4-dicarboxylate transport system permease small subunit